MLVDKKDEEIESELELLLLRHPFSYVIPKYMTKCVCSEHFTFLHILVDKYFLYLNLQCLVFFFYKNVNNFSQNNYSAISLLGFDLGLDVLKLVCLTSN